MPRTIEATAKVYTALAQRIEKVWIPHIPLATTLKATVGWQTPALTPANAVFLANDISKRFLEFAGDQKASEVQTSEYWDNIANQADEIDFINFTSDQVGVIRSTFEFLYFVLHSLPTRSASVDWDKVKDGNLIPKKLSLKLRALESRITDLEPRASTIVDKIKVIEEAHDTAEQLPTDLEELKTAANKIKELQESAVTDRVLIQADRETSKTESERIREFLKEAEVLVKRCNEAYRITTSAGLAGAFEYRSKSLARAGWAWVAILTASLGGAVWLGTQRFEGLKGLLVGDHSGPIIALNLIFAILGVAAPVWLAWLATKNVGQAFRISEDYAFKASISKAYEGYRKEAVTLDEDFAKRLFGTALTRLDEAPSRFINRDDHSSPLEAMLGNETLKAFLSKFPDIQEKLFGFIVDQKAIVVGAASATVATLVKSESPKKPVLPKKDDVTVGE